MNDGDLGIRILSLDAGGPGVYFQLLVLKELMARMAFDLGTVEEVLPSAHFDLIVGSGYGSLVALCIGCLELSVEEAIDVLFRATHRIFHSESGSSSPEQASQRLRTTIQDIINQRGIPIDINLRDKLFASRRCKVYDSHQRAALLMSKRAFLTTSIVNASVSTIFRTYPVRQSSVNSTLVEAVCASLTIEGLFSPVLIGPTGREHSFTGSSLFHNNPMREALHEAERAFGRERKVAVILSLGAGRTPTLPIGKLVQGSFDSASLVSRMSFQSETVARELESSMGNIAAYLRLNVDCEVEESFIHDWSHLGTIAARAEGYLSQEPVNKAIDASLSSLQARTGSITISQLNKSSTIVLTAKTAPRTTSSFVLREKEWQKLTESLQNKSPGQLVVVLTGLGGTGKTQLVSHYIETYRQSYHHVVFVDASSEPNIRADLQAFARSLGPGHERDTVDDALSYLANEQGRDWLLCFDNVDKTGISLVSFFPRCHFGTIMITSRNPALGRLASAYHLELGTLSQEESLRLLEKSSRRDPLHPASDDWDHAHALAEELGCLALALNQAGSYCRHMSSLSADSVFSFEQYRLLLRGHRLELMKRPIAVDLDDYGKGVYTTLELSFSQLGSEAKTLLHLLGFFHHASIPLSLFANAVEKGFRDAVSLLPRGGSSKELNLLQSSLLSQGGWSELAIHDLLQELNSFSLITLQFSSSTVMILLHPLVCSWAKDSLSPSEAEQYRKAARRVMSSFPATEGHHMHQHLTTHIFQLAQKADRPELEVNELLGFGSLLQMVGQLSMAEGLYQQALQSARAAIGHDDPRIIDITQYMATLALETGRLREAELMQLEILARRETMGVQGRMLTIEAESRLASVYRLQGRWSESERLDVKVLEYRREHLGDNHRDTLHALENLARTYWELGRWKEAVVLEEEVLSKRKCLLGIDDIETSRAESTLANSYFRLGQRADILKQETDIWNRRERLLGSRHPDTLASKVSLASTYRDTGSWTTAARLLTEVLQTQKEILGIDHPDLYATMSDLSHTLWLQGNWRECERLESETLAWKERHLGKDHPDTVTAAIDLGCTYLDLGRWREAATIQEEGLTSRRTTVGEKHPLTLQAKLVLAATYRVNGKWSEAETLVEEVLAVRHDMLGREHPDSIHAQGSLAAIYFRQGRYEKGEKLELEVWEMCQRHFGPAAPATIHAMSNLAETWRELGRLEEAKKMQYDALAMAVTTFGPDHPDTLLGRGSYARTLAWLNSTKEALQLQEEVLQRTQNTLGPKHPNTYLAVRGLAVTYRQVGRLDEALRNLQENLEEWIGFVGRDHPATMETAYEILETYRLLERLAERDQMWEDWKGRFRRILGEEHPLFVKLRRQGL